MSLIQEGDFHDGAYVSQFGITIVFSTDSAVWSAASRGHCLMSFRDIVPPTVCLESEVLPETPPPLPPFLDAECWRLSLFLRCSCWTASGVRVSIKWASSWCLAFDFKLGSLFTELWLTCLCFSVFDRDSPELDTRMLSVFDECRNLRLGIDPQWQIGSWQVTPGLAFLPNCLRVEVSCSVTEPPLSSLWTLAWLELL